MGGALTRPGYHCVLLGLDGSGKTTILNRIKFGRYTNTQPTIGFNCQKVSQTEWLVGCGVRSMARMLRLTSNNINCSL